MALSTNSIFHFTKYNDILKSILGEGGFKITYCLETFKISGATFQIGIPMVSFCDIPLSNVANQIDSYGGYSIGLSKKWAKRNGLNPVLYMQDNSSCSKLILPHIRNVLDNDEFNDIRVQFDLTQLDERTVQIRDVMTGERAERINVTVGLLSFIKNDEGELHRQGNLVKKKYKYYDEREWRYVPTVEEFERHRLSYEPFISA